MPRGNVSIAKRLNNLLQQATQSDLDGFDDEIAAAEARVKSLKQAREIVAEEVLNRADQKPTPVRSTKPLPNGKSPHDGSGNIKDRIARFLFDRGPSMKRKMVSEGIGNDLEVERALEDNPSTFHKSGNTYALSNEARAKYDPKEDE